MSRAPACRHRVLPAAPVRRVSVCDHDTVHLDVGALTLRLSPDQLESLANTPAAACVDLGISGRSADARSLC